MCEVYIGGVCNVAYAKEQRQFLPSCLATLEPNKEPIDPFNRRLWLGLSNVPWKQIGQ